jgi:hypothetical protein
MARLRGMMLILVSSTYLNVFVGSTVFTERESKIIFQTLSFYLRNVKK